MASRATLLRVLAVLAIAAGAFAWGLHAGHTKSFPFALAQRLARLVAPRPIEIVRYADTTGRSAAPCPRDAIVVLAIGQSNAANHLAVAPAPIESPQTFNFHAGRCYRLADPVLGATGTGGSLWPLFADKLSAATGGKAVVMITVAVGGATVDQWLRRPTEFVRHGEQQLAAARAQSLSATLVIWHQGESDGHAGTSASHYGDDLEALIARVRAEPGMAAVPWIVFQASRCGQRSGGSAAVRAGQAAVAARVGAIHLAMDTDTLGDGMRTDGCHFNDNGRRVIAAHLVDLIRRQRLAPTVP